MSGIAGVIRFGGVAGAQELEAMLQPMRVRGPDRHALACHGEAGFCHALLATTVEATIEQQPWRHPASGCLVVSDSRLDNRPQLLRELGIDRPADSVGDCELLHAAWQRWREGCADRLRGDFTFALWHPAERELYLARDPMGVRPLQFHFAPSRLLVFGSCTEAVLAQGEVPATVDEGRIADALIGETEGIDQTCTFFTSIQRLPPAHWMRVVDGALVQQRYWRPVGAERPHGLPDTEQEWIEAQRERLDHAVRLRLRSHRPVGSMLSGGLDSSSIVALASAAYSAQGRPPFPVFSGINSADPECVETRAVRAVVASAHCTPTFVDLPEFQQSQTPVHRLWHEADEPFDGTMSMVAAVYQAAASHGVVSVMDGAAADNLFTVGRRARFLFDQGHVLQAWRAAVTQWQVPGILFPRLHATRVMAGCLAPPRLHALRNRLADARLYRALLEASAISPGFAEETGLRERFRRYRRTIRDSHQWHDSGGALSTMTAPYITAGLERYNRVASLYGVEPRMPYTDRDLIEFQAWMPLPLRIRDGHRKWVLRQAMAELLPPNVTWRRDKNHLGGRFNQVLLQRERATDPLPSHSAGIEHGQVAHDGSTPAARRLLLWRRRMGV